MGITRAIYTGTKRVETLAGSGGYELAGNDSRPCNIPAIVTSFPFSPPSPPTHSAFVAASSSPNQGQEEDGFFGRVLHRREGYSRRELVLGIPQKVFFLLRELAMYCDLISSYCCCYCFCARWISFKEVANSPESYYEAEIENMKDPTISTTMFIDFAHVSRFSGVLQKALSEEFLRLIFFPCFDLLCQLMFVFLSHFTHRSLLSNL